MTCKDDLEAGRQDHPLRGGAQCDQHVRTDRDRHKVEGTTISWRHDSGGLREQLEKSVSSLVSDASGANVDSVICSSGLEALAVPKRTAMSRSGRHDHAAHRR